MVQKNDWLSFSIFSPPGSWLHLVPKLDDLLNSDAEGALTVMRIIEMNYLYGSNIRLFVLPAIGKSIPVAEQLQAFFRDGLQGQVVPGIQSKIVAGNTTSLAIRVLLSDAIFAAFRTEIMSDKVLFNMAMYMNLALLELNKEAIAILRSVRCKNVSHHETEYSQNRDVLYELKRNIAHGIDLPAWLVAWMAGYKIIMEAAPEPVHSAIYRSTVYLIAKQLGLSAPMMMKLEYFFRKIVEDAIVHS
jgi:hypothetical protein